MSEEIEKALYKAKFISESNFGNLKKLGWGLGSRTDKGVHAALNVIKCNLQIPLDYITNIDKKKEIEEIKLTK